MESSINARLAASEADEPAPSGADVWPRPPDEFSPSRRQLLAGTGGVGLFVATSQIRPRPGRSAPLSPDEDGTPERIHLTWGEDPATSMVVSWASPGEAIAARVLLTGGDGWTRTVPAEQASYTDGINGETVWAYHALFRWLAPDTSYSYIVTADNDSAAAPFSATFRTAPVGRAAFRFTSFGDLAAPSPAQMRSHGPGACAVAAVESFQPLFHLLNGEFGSNSQAPAAYRAWMPCPDGHEAEFSDGPNGFAAYQTRYHLPDNHVPDFAGRWYSFRIGSALFVSLDAGDILIGGYSGGAQTAWLERTLAAARADRTIDWIIASMHQASRPDWRPLWHRYAVDLVLNGHDRGYEIAVFDVDPGNAYNDQTSITARYFHAIGADAGASAPDYTECETFTLTRPRSDGGRTAT